MDAFPEGFKGKVKDGSDGKDAFIVKLPNGSLVLGETSGFDYMRYGIKLLNWDGLIEHKSYKDLWPDAECTMRNPAPPCALGMEERARPNGAMCCYKTTGKQTTGKKRPATRKGATKKCTARNPDPPCGPGMQEKMRPNGALCCYKLKN
jgi:hypothetical protein